MLILKLGAFIDGHESIKGQKDAVDILGPLLHSSVDIVLLKELYKKYSVDQKAIKSIIKNADNETLAYLGTDQHHFSRIRKKLLSEF